MKEIEFENKKLNELDKIIKDRSSRLSSGGFSSTNRPGIDASAVDDDRTNRELILNADANHDAANDTIELRDVGVRNGGE